VLLLEILQVGLLLGVAAVFFGWRADIDWWLLIGALLLGTAAFSGVAILMAGTLRAEATLALSNGLYVMFLLVGDVIFPLDALPEAIVRIGQVLPAAPLAGLFRAAVGQSELIGAHAVILIGWALLIPPLAIRFFKWEER
jgi:ABC-2 type transport system permease protein